VSNDDFFFGPCLIFFHTLSPRNTTMAVDQQALLNALQAVTDPNTEQDFVSTKALRNLHITHGDVSFDVELGYPAKSQMPALRQALIAAAKAVPGVDSVSVNLSFKVQAHAVQRGVQLMPNVKNIIAVASGKGGVGKSTTAVNLALALAAEGASVGILDADIYGPSQPTMMGLQGRPESSDGKTMEPLENYGVQVMSIGFLVDRDEAMVWRGPMATQALDQLLRQTNWRDLDYLIVDMPPGTGDIQLTLSQRVPLTGAVIVTTPQDIALIDARKGIKMFEKVGVPILGIVENMAVHVCENCGHVEHIFGADGGKKMAAEFEMDYLGALPLNMSIRVQADSGMPSVAADPDGEIAGLYKAVARQVAIKVAAKAKDFSSKFPTIKVSKDT
jgi:ATP-binding protein involved in chromosome partitioning